MTNVPLTRALVASLVAALIAVPPHLARGDNGDPALTQARAHFRRAETHFAMGRFKKALTEYEAAYEIKPLPGFLFNMGQCHRNLGNLERAVFLFKKYLRLKPESRNRAAVEELITNLETQIAARKEPPKPPPPPPPRIVVVQPPPPPPKPFYTKWWFWSLVVAVAAGTGVGVYFLTRPEALAPPQSGLGNIDFR